MEATIQFLRSNNIYVQNIRSIYENYENVENVENVESVESVGTNFVHHQFIKISLFFAKLSKSQLVETRRQAERSGGNALIDGEAGSEPRVGRANAPM